MPPPVSHSVSSPWLDYVLSWHQGPSLHMQRGRAESFPVWSLFLPGGPGAGRLSPPVSRGLVHPFSLFSVLPSVSFPQAAESLCVPARAKPVEDTLLTSSPVCVPGCPSAHWAFSLAAGSRSPPAQRLSCPTRTCWKAPHLWPAPKPAGALLLISQKVLSSNRWKWHIGLKYPAGCVRTCVGTAPSAPLPAPLNLSPERLTVAFLTCSPSTHPTCGH